MRQSKLSLEQETIRCLGDVLELAGDLFALIGVRTTGSPGHFNDDPKAVAWLAYCGKLLTQVGANVCAGAFIRATESLVILYSVFESHLKTPNSEVLDYLRYPGCDGLLIYPDNAMERINRLKEVLWAGASPSRTN